MFRISIKGGYPVRLFCILASVSFAVTLLVLQRNLLRKANVKYGVVVFTGMMYNKNVKKYPGKVKCIKMKTIKPTFTICPHDVKQDKYISGLLHLGLAWETNIAHLLHFALNSYKESVFVDVGANIGVHAVYAAVLGHKVWAVEPLTVNMMQLYRSAVQSKVLASIRLLKNSVDWRRGGATVAVTNQENLGGSHILQWSDAADAADAATAVADAKAAVLSEAVTSVLLSDVLRDVAWRTATLNGTTKTTTTTKPITLVLKLDIEEYECHALLGSRQIFQDRRFYIPYIVMEWHFFRGTVARGNGSDSSRPKAGAEYSPHCSKERVIELTRLFVKNGYMAYGEVANGTAWKKFDERQSERWAPSNIVWRHRHAPAFF